MEDSATDLNQLPVRELTARLASSDPIPGGGSAAAIAGAMGAALVSMVVELSVGRPDAAAHAEELVDIGDAARRQREELLSLAQEDAQAYRSVVTARRLPKETDAQRAERRATLSAAMRDAADAPLRAARAALEVLRLARRVAPIGNANAASDAGVAAQLASAAVRGAALNVRINLPYLADDEPLRVSAPAEIRALEEDAAALEAAALEAVEGRMKPS